MKTKIKDPETSKKHLEVVSKLRAIDQEDVPTLAPKEQPATDRIFQNYDLSGPMCEFLMRPDISLSAKATALIDEGRRRLRLASIAVDQGNEDAKIGDIELMAVSDALHEVDSLLGAAGELADRAGLL